jgi:hypothetical protein
MTENKKISLDDYLEKANTKRPVSNTENNEKETGLKKEKVIYYIT